MRNRYIIVHLPRLLRDSMSELLRNDPLRMAGATAFFTTFALPPILVILIQVLKLVIDPETVRTQLFQNLSGIGFVMSFEWTHGLKPGFYVGPSTFQISFNTGSPAIWVSVNVMAIVIIIFIHRLRRSIRHYEEELKLEEIEGYHP